MQSEYDDLSDAGSAGSESTEYEVRSVEAQEGLHETWSLGSIGVAHSMYLCTCTYVDSSDSGDEIRESNGKRAQVL